MTQIANVFLFNREARQLSAPAARMALCLLTYPDTAPDGVIDWPALVSILRFSPEDSAIAFHELAARWMVEFSFDADGVSGPTARVGAELLAFLTPASAARFMPDAAQAGDSE